MMNWFEALILGMIQGLTEFLPISSTGHLYLGRHLFGLSEAGLFLDTMLHLGTLIAVVYIYRQELYQLMKHPFSKLTGLLIVGTLPAVIVGMLFADLFESISKTGVTIGWEFLFTGLLLWGADSLKGEGRKQIGDISYLDALWIGVFQAAAIMPALSRSGLTIAAAIFRGIDRSTAAYFSFLLSIPAIAGAVVLQGSKLVTNSYDYVSIPSLLIATFSALIFGYMAIRWMIHIVSNRSLKGFAIYVFALGILVLFLQWIDVF